MDTLATLAGGVPSADFWMDLFFFGLVIFLVCSSCAFRSACLVRTTGRPANMVDQPHNHVRKTHAASLTSGLHLFIIKQQRHDFLGFEGIRLEISARNNHFLDLCGSATHSVKESEMYPFQAVFLPHSSHEPFAKSVLQCFPSLSTGIQ